MKRKNRFSGTLRIFIYFFIVLIICTWISRFTSSVLTPIVESQSPFSMSIEHQFSKTGTLKCKKETPVYLYAGILVDTIFVSEGENIQEGDWLLQYNLEKLNQEYQEKSLELKELQMERNTIWNHLEEQKMSLRIQEAEKSVETLKNLLESDGLVKSEIDGTVEIINQSIGTYSLDTVALIIGEREDGYLINIDITEEEKKYVIEGEEVTVVVGEEKEKALIDSVSLNAANGFYTVQISVNDNSYSTGETVEISFEHNSENYTMCLPVEALRSDKSGNSYVLIEKSANTILGEELVAEKTVVKIEDSNAEYAAISSNSLSLEDKVIINSNKKIESGDTVREE